MPSRALYDREHQRADQADHLAAHHLFKFCLLCTAAFQMSKKFPLIRLQPPNVRCWSEWHLHTNPPMSPGNLLSWSHLAWGHPSGEVTTADAIQGAGIVSVPSFGGWKSGWALTLLLEPLGQILPSATSCCWHWWGCLQSSDFTNCSSHSTVAVKLFKRDQKNPGRATKKMLIK